MHRPQRRYRRKVASPKQWQAISAAKLGPCRVCGSQARNGRLYGLIHLHHVVTRSDGGDDVPANIVPLCPDCHDRVTRRDRGACAALLVTLEPDEVRLHDPARRRVVPRTGLRAHLQPMSGILANGRYDSGLRRRAIRKQRETGCAVYIPAEELIKAGIDPHGPAPFYRVWGTQRGGVFVRLYREP